MFSCVEKKYEFLIKAENARNGPFYSHVSPVTTPWHRQAVLIRKGPDACSICCSNPRSCLGRYPPMPGPS